MAIKSVSSTVFLKSPGPGKGLMGGCFYTQRDGMRLLSLHVITQRSDTVETATLRYSNDNGHSWGETSEWPMCFAATSGVGRRHFWGGYLDKYTDRFIFFGTKRYYPMTTHSRGCANGPYTTLYLNRVAA